MDFIYDGFLPEDMRGMSAGSTPSPFFFGDDVIGGGMLMVGMDRLTHIVIAGITGSGKSTMLRTAICGLMRSGEALAMIDMKRVELSEFEGYPLLCSPIAKSDEGAARLLESLEGEMDRRFMSMEAKGIRFSDEKRITLIVDELADLTLGPCRARCKAALTRIAREGRAARISLILCTQRPTRDVIPGLLMANVPTKVCMRCANQGESVIVLGHKGAEALGQVGEMIVKLPYERSERACRARMLDDGDVDVIISHWGEAR